MIDYTLLPQKTAAKSQIINQTGFIYLISGALMVQDNFKSLYILPANRLIHLDPGLTYFSLTKDTTYAPIHPSQVTQTEHNLFLSNELEVARAFLSIARISSLPERMEALCNYLTEIGIDSLEPRYLYDLMGSSVSSVVRARRNSSLVNALYAKLSPYPSHTVPMHKGVIL